MENCGVSHNSLSSILTSGNMHHRLKRVELFDNRFLTVVSNRVTDFSENLLLERLEMHQWKLTSNFVPSVVLSLEELQSKIKELWLTGDKTPGLGLPVLCDGFSSLEKLDISNSSIPLSLFDDLSNKSKLSHMLKDLRIGRNNFAGEANVGFLSHLLKLKRLDIRDSGLDFISLDKILQTKRLQNKLEELVLRLNSLHGVVELPSLTNFASLKKLDMSSCMFDFKILNAILSCKRFQKKLGELILSSNDFSGPVDILLLKKFVSLKNLDMSNCKISLVTFSIILGFKNIENNIEELDVSHNDFSEGVGWAFFLGFKKLKKLNMNSCILGGIVLNDILMHGLSRNTLEELNLGLNNLLDNFNPEALARLTSLRKLNLLGSGVDAWLVNTILQSETLQGTLEELVLDGNWLSDDVNFRHLEKFVHLEVLNLSNCGLTFRSLDTILRCKRMQANLKELRISHNDFSGSTSLGLFNEFESLRILSMLKCSLDSVLLNVILGCDGLSETLRALLLSENDLSGKLDLVSLYKFSVLAKLTMVECKLGPESQGALTDFKKIHNKVRVLS